MCVSVFSLWHFLSPAKSVPHRKLHKWPEKVTLYSLNMQSHHTQPCILRGGVLWVLLTQVAKKGAVLFQFQYQITVSNFNFKIKFQILITNLDSKCQMTIPNFHYERGCTPAKNCNKQTSETNSLKWQGGCMPTRNNFLCLQTDKSINVGGTDKSIYRLLTGQINLSTVRWDR